MKEVLDHMYDYNIYFVKAIIRERADETERFFRSCVTKSRQRVAKKQATRMRTGFVQSLINAVLKGAACT